MKEVMDKTEHQGFFMHLVTACAVIILSPTVSES